MTIEAGQYDPTPGTIVTYPDDINDSGEPVRENPTTFCKVFVRFPTMTRMAMERILMSQTQSFGTLIINVRKNSKTKQIKPNMELHHDGVVYGIVNVQPLPSSMMDEIQLLCQYKQSC